MVKSIKVPDVKGYFKKLPSGKTVPINKDGSIKEIHDIWSDPIPKPKPKAKEKEPIEIPGIPYEHPPDYLVPRGHGIYTIPTDRNSPALDPQNCDGALGDISPWCGGNPFDNKAVGYDPELAFDNCNIWFKADPTVAFVKGTPFIIAYRFPGKCREEPPPPPPPPPGQSSRRLNKPGNIPADKLLYAFVSVSDSTSGTKKRYNSNTKKFEDYVYFGIADCRWSDYLCPGITHLEKRYFGSGSTDFIWYDSPIQGTLITSGANEIGSIPKQTFLVNWNENAGSYQRYAYTEDGTTVYSDSGVNTTKRYYNQGLTVSGILEVITLNGNYIYKGRWGLIDTVLERIVSEPSTTVDEGETSNSIYSVDFVVDLFCSTPRDRSKLPPPPNDGKPCCMACCNPTPNNDALLKEVLAQIKKANKAIGSDKFPVQATIFDENEDKEGAQNKVIKLTDIASSITKIIDRNEKLSKIIGIDTFPLELPESIIVHPESDNIFTKALNFLNPFKNVKIHSVMDLLVWKIKQDSAVLGQWGQTIKVTSTEKKKVTVDGKEIEKEVEKTDEVVLPNIAQTLKETILLQSQLLKNNGLVLDCVIKLMIDVAQGKAISAESLKRVEDIQQYLDYPTNERTVDVPIQITFPNPSHPQDVQNDLYKLLKEGKITITFDDWTGEHSQDEKFLDLLQAAKVIQGVYFNKA